jgi:CRP-like cAMP-binding protein
MIDPDSLGRLALFADLTPAELEAAAQLFDEQRYEAGERVLRQGLRGNAFYVLLEGEVAVEINGTERARLRPGDFFGEISILTSEPPGADVIAATPLRCGLLPEPEVIPFLIRNPTVMLRMLRVEAKRLHLANLWQG